MTAVPPAGFTAPKRYKLTDVGNAERLLDAHGEDLRYVGVWDAWLVWDGRRWCEDSLGRVVELAKAVARAMWGELAGDVPDDHRKALAKWIPASESAHHIAAMIRLARSDPRVAIDAEDLDVKPWLLNVENGTLDLRTGKLRPHRREDLVTKVAPVRFDPDAKCPTWERTLERCLADVNVEAFLQEVVGYAVTGSVSEQIVVFWHGIGANGKSTCIGALLDLLGEYARTIDSDVLLSRREQHPTGLTDLKGARLVSTSEIDEGRRLAEATLKKLTGGGRISARRMRQDFFEFDPTHKLFIDANHRPIVRGTDHAIWRRIRMVPFPVTLPRSEWDRELPAKLAAERSGILNWALAGCLRWQRDGLSMPDAVEAATNAYRADMDVLGDYLETRCIRAEDVFVAAEQLYSDYSHWCDSAGERALTQRELGAELTDRGLVRRKHGASRRWHWFGIGVLNPCTPANPDPLFPDHTYAYRAGTGDKGSEGFMGSAQARDEPVQQRADLA